MRKEVHKKHIQKLNAEFEELLYNAKPTYETRGRFIMIKVEIAMRKKNMTRLDLAVLLGVTPPLVTMLLKGTRNPTANTLFILEDALDIVIFDRRI